MHGHLLINIVILLAMAVITVSLSRRLHFPPILGYIIVGIIVGPSGFAFIEKEENIELLAEFGIVFLLFAIGLEFSVSQMLSMKKPNALLSTHPTIQLERCSPKKSLNLLLKGNYWM